MDDAGPPGPPGRLTSKDAAARIGVTASKLSKIPRDELPYATSPGGDRRGGRRYYHPEDLDAYRDWLDGKGPSLPALARQMREIAARVERLEQQHPGE